MHTLPHCPHRGRILGSRCFCRCPDVPGRTVSLEMCHGCPSATTPPAGLAPVCPHRTAATGLITTGCAMTRGHQIFGCAVHGSCVLTPRQREEVRGARCCATCTDRPGSATATASTDELAIVAVHFNPQRYCLPIRNYWQWRHSLGDLQANLITVELSFDGLFCIPDARHVQGGPDNIMWQKERLINLAIERLLPEQCKFVAWVDHDLIFSNTDWAEQTVEMLSGDYDVVQLYDTWTHYDSQGRVNHRRNSLAARHLAGIATQTGPLSPGGAWAARRDYLERIGGIYQTDIVGGGDQGCCDAWLGLRSSYHRLYTEFQKAESTRWQQLARSAMRQCGYVPGNVDHLYHGDRQHRGYEDRHAILLRHNYNPELDIRINNTGILAWDSEKPDLHQEVAHYFASRQEDA